VVNNSDLVGNSLDDVLDDDLVFLGWFLQNKFDFDGDLFDVSSNDLVYPYDVLLDVFDNLV